MIETVEEARTLYEIADAMYRALAMLPCRCQYNVPYDSGKVKQVVKLRCTRCEAMMRWESFILP